MKPKSDDIPGAVEKRGDGDPLLSFWTELVRKHRDRLVTPAYVFSSVPVAEAYAELSGYGKELNIRHFLSVKTQPLPALVRWWAGMGRPVEVVSEWEFEMALRCGVVPERLLLNGPLKQHWLPKHGVKGLWVHLDSPAEAEVLVPLARERGWRLGVRLNTREEYDPESPGHPTQFGMDGEELGRVLQLLGRHEVRAESVHFHLRTNIPDVATYERALEDASRMCGEAGLRPRFVDVGGGLPPPRVRTKSGLALNRQFGFESMILLLKRARKWFPGMEEWWMENGRWMLARSGVLVTTVRDIKVRRGMRTLICDGGRTMNALVSLWEDHDLTLEPDRRGEKVATTVHGPTCMAFDKLYRGPLPCDVGVGDRILWHDAGAYHLPWETRFSHGLAGVWWHEGGGGETSLRCVRKPEPFGTWWGQWLDAGAGAGAGVGEVGDVRGGMDGGQ